MDSRKRMIEGMKVLLENNRIENITVQMILEQSGVSRASFYRAFSDKYDLMHSYYLEFLEKRLQENPLSLYKLTASTLEFMFDNKAYFINIARYGGQNSFSSTLYEYLYSCACKRTTCKRERELTDEELTSIEFYCAGSVACIEKWIMQGMKYSPQTFAGFLTSCLPAVLR